MEAHGEEVLLVADYTGAFAEDARFVLVELLSRRMLVCVRVKLDPGVMVVVFGLRRDAVRRKLITKDSPFLRDPLSSQRSAHVQGRKGV